MQIGIHILFYFVKIYVGFVANIDIKILGAPPPPPPGVGNVFFQKNKIAERGGGFFFPKVFFPV